MHKHLSLKNTQRLQNTPPWGRGSLGGRLPLCLIMAAGRRMQSVKGRDQRVEEESMRKQGGSWNHVRGIEGGR